MTQDTEERQRRKEPEEESEEQKLKGEEPQVKVKKVISPLETGIENLELERIRCE